MQGGHVDGIRGNPCERETDQRYDFTQYTTRVRLGEFVDRTLGALRQFFVVVLGLPIAWFYLSPTVESFRRSKIVTIKRGTQTVLWIQKFRTKFLDVYFQAWSFAAEEEFYLLTLPYLFWVVSGALGSDITLMICAGLFIGNLLKDVFRLPRPVSLCSPFERRGKATEL